MLSGRQCKYWKTDELNTLLYPARLNINLGWGAPTDFDDQKESAQFLKMKTHMKGTRPIHPLFTYLNVVPFHRWDWGGRIGCYTCSMLLVTWFQRMFSALSVDIKHFSLTLIVFFQQFHTVYVINFIQEWKVCKLINLPSSCFLW